MLHAELVKLTLQRGKVGEVARTIATLLHPHLTGVETDNVPKVFALHKNYPNPFNPSTEIKFTVEKAAPTTLIVYNMLGQEVATLFNGVAQPGRYYVLKFAAENLASGMYLYRLESNNKSAVAKMLLLK